ncbi:MAG: hypothetical protein ABF242_10445 [Flavobacteriales bacterium]
MKQTFLSLFSILLLAGCVKEELNLSNINSDTFNPSFALPVASARLQVGRINESGNRFLEVNPTTGILEFSYLSEAFRVGFSDIYQVNSQAFNTSVGMPSGTVSTFNASALGTSATFSASNTAAITVPGPELLDSIIVQNGNLNIALSSGFAHTTSVTLTIPSLVRNGIPFSAVIPLTYSGTVPVSATLSASIDGYTVDLTDAGTATNTVRFNYSVAITRGATPVTGTESIDFNFSLGLNRVDRAFGYFGNTVKTDNDTVEFDLFGNLFGGTLSFANPRMEFTIINTTGVDIDADFTSVSAPENTIIQNIAGPGLTAIPTIVAAASIGDSTITSHLIDNSNTSPSISQLMNEKPSKFAFATRFQFNPSGFTQNFITQNSKIEAQSKLVIPLDLYGSDFALSDTNNSDIEDVFGISEQDAENIDKITLRLNVTNRLPIEAGLQVYFADNLNGIIDSLFDAGTQMILNGATVNFSVPVTDPNYGKAISAENNTLDIIMTQAKYVKLIQAGSEKIIFKASINTVDAALMKYVKIFPEDYIDIKVSAKLDLNVVIK